MTERAVVVFLSPQELASEVGGVVSARTLVRWARKGHICNARQLANGQIVFLPEAASEIITPVHVENAEKDRDDVESTNAQRSGVIAGQLEIFG